MRRSKRTIKNPKIFDPADDPLEISDKETEVPIEQDEKPVKINPWNVVNFEAFLFYDCPECSHKCQDRTTFAKHAVMKHQQSNDLVQRMVQDGSVKIDLSAFQKISDQVNEKPQIAQVKKAKLKPQTDVIQCYVCGFEHCEKVKVIEHVQEVHFPEAKLSMYGIPREFQCTDCQIMFSTPGALGLHLCGVLPPRWSGDYSGAKKCQDCGKSFKKRYVVQFLLLYIQLVPLKLACWVLILMGHAVHRKDFQ